MPEQRNRPWAPVTSWVGTAVAAAAAVLLVVLAYSGPSEPITDADFSGSTVFVARLAGGVLMGVLTASDLLQTGLYLPQRAAAAPGLPAPAVLDLLLIAGVVVETALVLSVGFRSAPYLDLAIVLGGAAIAGLAVIRFAVIATTGIRELVARRRSRA
jgi:hypothetical protein